MILYDNINYAADRLQGTIVRYKNKPVLINTIGNGKCIISYLSNGLMDTVNYDKNFDITPVPLGYCNYKGSAIYICRSPVRKDWKQGLRSATVRGMAMGKPVLDGLIVDNNELASSIMGIYPDVKEAIAKSSVSSKYSCAFSREFAVDGANNIWYKASFTIGKIYSKDEFLIEEKYFWASESFHEAIK